MSSVFYYTKDSIKNFKELRHLQLVGQEDKVLSEEEKEQQGKIELYKNCAIFTGDIGLVGYPILEGDIVRSATLVELIDLGEQQLLEGEILNREAGTIDKIPQPSYQYKWDFEKLKWLPDEKLLQDGQYIEGEKIVDIPYDDTLGYLIPTWDKVSKTWKEGATEEQKTEQYKYLINSYKAQILEQGYNYNNHQQKCREKDLALLGNAVSALDDMQTFAHTEEKRINWAFNDDDIVVMTETDLRKLRMAGCEFINNIYKIEAELKNSEVNLKLTGKEFIDKINAVSQVKCYFNDIKRTEIQNTEIIGGGGTNLSTYNLLSQNQNIRIQKPNLKASPISLNSIDEKVRKLEGTSRVVPIDMKSLDDRINNLISNAQSYQIINYSDRGYDLDITSKYGIKLNSNSSVALINARLGDSSKRASYGPVKGDFSVLVLQGNSESRKTYFKRVGNSILLHNHSDGLYQSGTIIILD